MLTGIPVALAMLAQASGVAQQPAPPPPPKTAARSDGKAADSCPPPSTTSEAIVICTERPKGYRLNPDVMEAKREMKNPGRPVRPGGANGIIPDCAHVGPAPCLTGGVDLLSAAAAAAVMAERLAAGEAVGPMFKTDPHPSEYQRYQMAKARREAEEAHKAAEKVKADAEAKDAVKPAAD